MPATNPAVPPCDTPGHADAAGPANPASAAGGWTRLVRRYRRPLAAVARRLLRRRGLPARREDVQELLQDLWCRVFERGPASLTDGLDHTLSYLVAVLRNLATDRLRRASAQKRGGLRRRVGFSALGVLVAPEATPEQHLLGREERRLALARLRPRSNAATRRRDLAVFELALLEGWSSRRISRALGGRLAPSSIDSLVHRLRRGFAAEGIELPRRGCGRG